MAIKAVEVDEFFIECVQGNKNRENTSMDHVSQGDNNDEYLKTDLERVAYGKGHFKERDIQSF